MKASVRWVLAIVLVVSAAAIAGPAFAGTSPKLNESVVVRAPANESAAPDSFFDSVSCPVAGFCEAGGGYRDKANRYEPMVAQSDNGKWSRGTEVRLPSNSSVGIARVDAIDCTSPGNCVAVGEYDIPRTGAAPAFIAVEANGRWHHAMVPSPPAKSRFGQPQAELDAVRCQAGGSCVAVGGYDNRARHALPMVIVESHGRWGRAHRLPLPANARPGLDMFVSALSCPALGHCVAGGQYDTPSGTTAAMVITQSADRWRAAELGVPPDPSRFSDYRLASISCPGIGNCEAVGTYSSRGDNSSSFAVTESGGRWRQPVRVAVVPDNAARLSHLELDSVTCTRPGSCLAGGGYTNRGHGRLALEAIETSGKWIRASEIMLPGDVRSTQQNGILADDPAVDCPRTGHCTAVGSYEHGITARGFSKSSADAAQIASPGGR